MMKMTDPLVRQVRPRCGEMQGGVVLCAVSGGRDSMALLHLLSALAREDGFQVEAGHFNHQLRPTADRDESFVREWCRAHGVPLTCGRGDVRAFARREGLSIEDAARTLRYAFLETAARDMGADRIATAHHREDNAETVLLHLLRGTGLQGLGGIPPARGNIVRPLLETSRADIDAYIGRHNIPYVEDESNADPAYTRNRLRLEVLPLLEEIAPGAAGRIAAAASLLREEDEHLQREAERAGSTSHGLDSLTRSGVWSSGAVLGRRMIRSATRQLGAELDRRTTENVLRLGAGGYLDLPGGLCALRKGDALTLRRVPPPLEPLILHPGGQTWGPWRVTVERQEGPVEEAPDRVVLRDTGQPLTIAPWDGTGRLQVENGSRSIKRLFADAGIPIEKRAEHPVILADGKAAAVIGVAVDWACRPHDGDFCTVVTLRWCNKED